MTDTLAKWLQLREPADGSARSSTVTQALNAALPTRNQLRLLDLGTGTGANVRYLATRLPQRQRWLIVDRDPELLTRIPDRMSSWASTHGFELQSRNGECVIQGERLTCTIETQSLDLDALDDAALFTGRDVVTASALLDLASESWLATLAGRCRDAGAAVLFALTYNGWSSCSPAEPEDDMVRDLLNRHQLTDKGLGGPAAGPGAAELVASCFAEAGYLIRTERSDWTLLASENALQRRLVDGWADAGAALEPDTRDTIDRWRRRRHEHIDASRSRIVVGHVDMAGWQPT